MINNKILEKLPGEILFSNKILEQLPREILFSFAHGNSSDPENNDIKKLINDKLLSIISTTYRLSLTCKCVNLKLKKYIDIFREEKNRMEIPKIWFNFALGLQNCNKKNIKFKSSDAKQFKSSDAKALEKFYSSLIKFYDNEPNIEDLNTFYSHENNAQLAEKFIEYNAHLIQDLDFSNCSLKTPHLFFDFTNVINLEITRNNINNISFINHFPNLKYANFGYNEINEINGSHNKIEDLILYSNLIDKIPKNLELMFKNLKILHLTKNKLENIYVEHEKLEILFVEENKIEAFYLKCQNLKQININFNLIKENKKIYFNCPNLKKLSVDERLLEILKETKKQPNKITYVIYEGAIGSEKVIRYCDEGAIGSEKVIRYCDEGALGSKKVIKYYELSYDSSNNPCFIPDFGHSKN